MRDLRSNRKRIGPTGRKRAGFFHDFPKLRCFYPPGAAARGNARRMINQPLSGWFTGALTGPISCGIPLKKTSNGSSITLFAPQAPCKGLYPSSSKMYCFALGSSASWNLFLLLKCCLWTLKLGLLSCLIGDKKPALPKLDWEGLARIRLPGCFSRRCGKRWGLCRIAAKKPG